MYINYLFFGLQRWLKKNIANLKWNNDVLNWGIYLSQSLGPPIALNQSRSRNGFQKKGLARTGVLYNDPKKDDDGSHHKKKVWNSNK